MIDRVLSWCTEHEGSTRAVGLLRVALASIVLIRYGDEVAFFAAGDALHVAVAVFYFAFVPLMLVGLYSRIATVMVALVLLVMYFPLGYLPDRVGWNHHHSYILLISVFFLSFTPCGRSYSVDRWREIGQSEASGIAPRPEFGRLWGTRLIGLQMSALYFWTAVDKTEWAFLSGERLEQIMVWQYAGRPLEAWVMMPAFLVAGSILVVVVEYLLAVAIHVPRLQKIAIPAALALHAGFYVLLPVDTYSITMMMLYLVVVDPNAVHRFIDRMQGYAAPAAHRL